MAAKGGGSWKVAYADFVTAMMAFFLVMWICGQDQKIKRSVSDYFSDPLGSTNSGGAKKPNRMGSTHENINSGNVPLEEGVNLGTGRRSHSDRRPGQSTKAVADWIHHDKQSGEYWRRQAKEQLEAARWTKEVKEGRSTIEKTAIGLLTKQLEDELAREIPAKTAGMYRAMIDEIMQQINWTEIAEDLIAP
jgi:chemotaxis protein MotB